MIKIGHTNPDRIYRSIIGKGMKNFNDSKDLGEEIGHNHADWLSREMRAINMNICYDF